MININSIPNARRSLCAALCALLLAASGACTDEEKPPRSNADSVGGKADTAGDEDSDPGGPEPEPQPEPDPEPQPEPEPEPEPERNFIDAQSYFQTSEEIDAWFQIRQDLRSDFDEVCGDTFCEGDYSNFESLRFRCSVEQTEGTMGGCVWVFGASNEEIAPATGELTVDGQIFACPMPVAAGTDIRAFVAALTAPDVQPIRAPLPGSDLTLYDGLIDCL
jgi:hypothetical protein